jgi:hypothetical protein
MHDANTPCCAKRVSVTGWATSGNRDYAGDGGDVQDEQCVSHGGLSENTRRSFPVVPNLAPNASRGREGGREGEGAMCVLSSVISEINFR